MKTEFIDFLNENSEVKKLQKELKQKEDWFYYHGYGKPGHEHWDEKAEECAEIRRKLYQLTGDYYGKTNADKEKKNVKPKGLNNSYDYPTDVPKSVYK
jgi:hypothetical protein